jgi:hypothetical protein
MTPWTEYNFLERLMPQLRRENGVPMESCPDSELLSAFTEDQVSPFLRDAVAAHLTRCQKCQEIYARLGQFAQASVPAQDAEWINAEKRLENWMGGFLHERAKETRSVAKAEPSMPALRWKDISKAALSWKLGWALGMAAVLAFAVAGMVLTRRGPVGSAPVQIAAKHPALPQDQITNPAQTSDVPFESPQHASPESAKQLSGTNSGGTSQRAESYIPPKPVASKNVLLHEAQTQSSSAAWDFRLEAGTYLWIWLNGTLPENGTLGFQGTLMPPVARSGAVLLNPGTEIDGSVTVKHGDISSILVTEIVVQGLPYKLRGTTGATSVDTPGSGWALPFYEGQELKMQLTAASVYERPSGGPPSEGGHLGNTVMTHRGSVHAPGHTAAGSPAVPPRK